MKKIQPLHLVLGGAGLVILGAFLPWVSISTNFMNQSSTQSKNGIDGDGVITLILGIIALVLTVLKNPSLTKPLALIAFIASVLIAAIGIYDATQIGGNAETKAMLEVMGDAIKISLGIGLYFTIAGGIAAAVGSFQRWRSATGAPPAQQPPAQPPAIPQA